MGKDNRVGQGEQWWGQEIGTTVVQPQFKKERKKIPILDKLTMLGQLS